MFDIETLIEVYEKLYFARGWFNLTKKQRVALVSLLEPLVYKDYIVIPLLIISVMRHLDNDAKLHLVERLAKSIGREIL